MIFWVDNTVSCHNKVSLERVQSCFTCYSQYILKVGQHVTALPSWSYFSGCSPHPRSPVSPQNDDLRAIATYFGRKQWRNWMQRKQKWAWRKWKMPSACYSPLCEIKSPFLGGSWKVWMPARSSQVPPCRNLSLPGCLYNGSAINHHFWSCCRHLAWAIGGIRQLDLTNVAHFCPGAAAPKLYHPVETQNGNYSTLSPVAQMQGLNIIIIIYVHKKVCIGFGAY